MIERWCVVKAGGAIESVSFDRLREMAEDGALCETDMVRSGEGGSWVSASVVPGLRFRSTAGAGIAATTSSADSRAKPRLVKWTRRIRKVFLRSTLSSVGILLLIGIIELADAPRLVKAVTAIGITLSAATVILSGDLLGVLSCLRIFTSALQMAGIDRT